MKGVVPALLVLAVATLGGTVAGAQQKTTPLVLRADVVRYDQEAGVVTAKGHVEIAQGERILLADEVTYDQSSGVAEARGNVVLREPSGEVLFATEARLADDLTEGFLRNIRIRLGGTSRLAAASGRRVGGVRTELEKAVFSPCKICAQHPDRAPLWQIKAVRVTHDQRRKEIEYRDAFLEFFGIPVAYTPYFSSPDPSVKRKSGFLTPSFSSTNNLGMTFTVPYFFNLAPYRDFTFAPIFTTDEGVVLTGEYRERTPKGSFSFSGSITRPDARDSNGNPAPGKETRGHIFGTGRFDISDQVHWGFDIARATDDTYLRRYEFSSADTLTSRLFAEDFQGRNYAAINAYTFQGLAAEDSQGATPYILPAVEYALVGPTDRLGGRLSVDGDLLVLGRTEGTDSRRLSLTGAWQRPFVSPLGDLFTFKASLRGDLYLVNDVADPLDPTAPQSSGLTGRVVPQASLAWRYPWISDSGALRQVIEPVALIAYSPNGGNPDDVPNEDSQDFELNDTNFLSADRFPGLDRVEGGFRAAYGLRYGVYGPGGGHVATFIGQSYRLRNDATFTRGSGLADNFSDVVGRVDVVPSSYFDLSYRFRFDQSNFTIRRNEVVAGFGPWWLQFSVNYLSLDDPPPGEPDLGQREEISTTVSAALSDNWTLVAHNRQDLTGAGTVTTGAGLTYEDECFLVRTTVDRDFTVDRDVAKEFTFKVQVQFKHLG